MALAAGTLVLVSGGSLIFTLLAELQDRAGFDAWGLGVVAFAYFLTSFFAQLLLARRADRGKARELMVIGVVCSVAALVWFAFASSLFTMIAARSLGGLGFGLWEPAAKATAVAGREGEAGKRLGILTAASTGGIVLGPLIGAGIFLATDSLAAPFLFWAVMIAALVFPLALRVPVAKPDESRTAAVKPRDVLRNPAARRAVVVAVALLMPIGMYEVVWARLLTDLGAGVGFIGISVALYGLPFFVIAPFGGALGDRIGSEKVAGIGALAVTAVIFSMGLSTNFVVLTIIGTFEAVINALAIPNAYASMVRACAPNQQATGQGIVGGSGLAAAGAMTLIAGVVYGAWGQFGVFATTAGAVLVFAVGAWLLGVRDAGATPPVGEVASTVG